MMFGRIARGFKWLGKKVGRGGKEVGKGAIWVFARPEVALIANFVPVPGLKTATDIVSALNTKELPGTMKAQIAINRLREEPMFKDMKESELRWTIETALQVAEGRITYEEGKDDE